MEPISSFAAELRVVAPSMRSICFIQSKQMVLNLGGFCGGTARTLLPSDPIQFVGSEWTSCYHRPNDQERSFTRTRRCSPSSRCRLSLLLDTASRGFEPVRLARVSTPQGIVIIPWHGPEETHVADREQLRSDGLRSLDHGTGSTRRSPFPATARRAGDDCSVRAPLSPV